MEDSDYLYQPGQHSFEVDLPSQDIVTLLDQLYVCDSAHYHWTTTGSDMQYDHDDDFSTVWHTSPMVPLLIVPIDETQAGYTKDGFSQVDDMTRRERAQTGHKSFKCKHCHKCFTLSSDLIRHERTHTR